MSLSCAKGTPPRAPARTSPGSRSYRPSDLVSLIVANAGGRAFGAGLFLTCGGAVGGVVVGQPRRVLTAPRRLDGRVQRDRGLVLVASGGDAQAPASKNDLTKPTAAESVRSASGLAMPPGSSRASQSSAGGRADHLVDVEGVAAVRGLNAWTLPLCVDTRRGVPPASRTACQGSVSSTCSTPSGATRNAMVAMVFPCKVTMRRRPPCVCTQRSRHPAAKSAQATRSPKHRQGFHAPSPPPARSPCPRHVLVVHGGWR